ncbi:hypothetical protein [Comamonas sp. B21-038]|uniref:hypothetical protein n=1 Tax=Comamonas sp. B21-038 TaxID=2918299 RepID=UPI001EFB5B6C|nr:hypothetical protein [Comamonas sp. B21-038]ULR88615.1 hypothetical protein MJ205_19615 [Comamonas sp. B21-038]
MNDSERLAIAAHLHVALRRKTGRVTDTEWMASDTAYGQAMAQFALNHARSHQDAELERLALRFAASLPGAPAPAAATMGTAGAAADAAEPGLVASAKRYVGGLR